jgi:hypothetical protein
MVCVYILADSRMSSGEGTPGGGDNGSVDQTSTVPVKKRFLNGWTSELEDLIADWADKAACYRWMHEKTNGIFAIRDRYFNIPVIILSGVTAGANFALGSIFDEKQVEEKKWAQLGLGGASLIAGIIQTLMNFYRYAQLSEAHRVSGISWGKFNRLLCIEMSLHPDERMDAFNFLKLFRVELDRLIEQSPSIPDLVIKDFNTIFNKVDVVKPEIVGILNHTKVYKDTGARLKRIAAEATIALHFKRGVIKQLVVDDLQTKMVKAATEAARSSAQAFFEEQRKAALEIAKANVAAAAKKLEPKATMPSIIARRQAEQKQELNTIAIQRAGAVAELKERFKNSTIAAKGATAVKDEQQSEQQQQQQQQSVSFALDTGDLNTGAPNIDTAITVNVVGEGIGTPTTDKYLAASQNQSQDTFTVSANPIVPLGGGGEATAVTTAGTNTIDESDVVQVTVVDSESEDEAAQNFSTPNGETQ